MNHELHLAPRFGTFLAEGSLVAEFRMRDVEPFFRAYETITLDFAGVRNANSSFMNALIVPLVETHGEDGLRKLRFKGCNSIVRILVESALTLGLQKARERGSRAAR
jgi:hypothetical protein